MKPSTEWIKSNIKGVIFDLDGTMIDSMSMWDDIDIEYLARFGYELPDDYQKKIEGISFHEVAVYTKKRFRIPDSVEQMMQDWNDMAFDFYQNRIPLKPGVRKFLQFLETNAIPCGIATSNSPELLGAVLDSHNIRNFFSVIVTGSEVAHGKPAPDIYLHAADRLQLKPSECLVFEDVEAGLLAARSAGMNVCAVYDKYSHISVPEAEALSDYYLNGFEELDYEAFEG